MGASAHVDEAFSSASPALRRSTSRGTSRSLAFSAQYILLVVYPVLSTLHHVKYVDLNLLLQVLSLGF